MHRRCKCCRRIICLLTTSIQDLLIFRAKSLVSVLSLGRVQGVKNVEIFFLLFHPTCIITTGKMTRKECLQFQIIMLIIILRSMLVKSSNKTDELRQNRTEDTPSKLNLYRSSQKGINGLIDTAQARMRHYNDGSLKRKFIEEWADNGRQGYAYDSDGDSSKNFMVKGMSTVHGSQCFYKPEGAVDPNLTQESNKQINKGHSIGYYQVNNVNEYNDPRCHNMKEQIVRSRPTSSSSNFMQVNPLLGVNSKYNHNIRFQPLDGEIIEEKEKDLIKKHKKAHKKRTKKKKKKVFRCKVEETEYEREEKHKAQRLSPIPSRHESPTKTNGQQSHRVLSNKKIDIEKKEIEYNLKYQEVENSGIYSSEGSQEEIDERYLAPMYKESQNQSSCKISKSKELLNPSICNASFKSTPMTPQMKKRFGSYFSKSQNNSMMLEIPQDLLSIKSYEIKPKSNKGALLSQQRSEKEKSLMMSQRATKSLRASASTASAKESIKKQLEKRSSVDEKAGSPFKLPRFSNIQLLENMKKDESKENESESEETEEEKEQGNNYEEEKVDEDERNNDCLSDEEDQSSEDDDIEEDDECVESRPISPESEENSKEKIDGLNIAKKPILTNESKNIIQARIPQCSSSKNQGGNSIKGTFTCKIVKKKGNDIDKGKMVAFGSTASRNDELTNQQILERKQKIHKYYHGPYKKKKNISLLCSVPKNLEEQKKLFFEAECNYNPQFVYDNENLTRKYLKQFFSENKSPEGVPQARNDLLKYATRILKNWLKDFGSESAFLKTEGEIISKEDTESIISKYLQDLEIEKLITLNFTKKMIAPTSIVHDSKKKKSRMNIRLPIEYREDRVLTMLHHEIGTHFCRKVNDRKQKWHGKKDKYDIASCIQTEEGFAVINQYSEYSLSPGKKAYFYKAALNYYSACKAGSLSFADLFKDLEQYIDDPNRRWHFTLRVKRGLTDTAQAGGLYKDQVYLEGAYKILKERKNINFHALISGKISLEDLDRPFLMKIIRCDHLIIPPFMRDMKKYMKGLDKLAKLNFDL
ncbi:unnamed protein product [Moneuplotes crassus]|uniref:DUF1704 domain-containing protein n=4 Tax=Euplotes crassus TaxID=5936 RepID=A0AAD1U8S0_EUPCR|nr:unnamed protein product [Moneuplotes crassus]